MFELCKSASFGFSPSECLVLLGEICEQLCKHGIVFDETMVEVGETKKAENVTHSIAKVFLGSAKIRRAILMKRPTSF